MRERSSTTRPAPRAISADTLSRREHGANSMSGMAGMNEKLLENLKRMGVPMAYGEKVDFGDASMVPVAISTFGFGGGEGDTHGGAKKSADVDESSDGRDATGAGVGGGGVSIPIGAYISDEFGTRFQANVIALLVAVLPLACVAGFALPRLVKALKR